MRRSNGVKSVLLILGCFISLFAVAEMAISDAEEVLGLNRRAKPRNIRDARELLLGRTTNAEERLKIQKAARAMLEQYGKRGGVVPMGSSRPSPVGRIRVEGPQGSWDVSRLSTVQEYTHFLREKISDGYHLYDVAYHLLYGMGPPLGEDMGTGHKNEEVRAKKWKALEKFLRQGNKLRTSPDGTQLSLLERDRPSVKELSKLRNLFYSAYQNYYGEHVLDEKPEARSFPFSEDFATYARQNYSDIPELRRAFWGRLKDFNNIIPAGSRNSQSIAEEVIAWLKTYEHHTKGESRADGIPRLVEHMMVDLRRQAERDPTIEIEKYTEQLMHVTANLDPNIRVRALGEFLLDLQQDFKNKKLTPDHYQAMSGAANQQLEAALAKNPDLRERLATEHSRFRYYKNKFTGNLDCSDLLGKAARDYKPSSR